MPHLIQYLLSSNINVGFSLKNNNCIEIMTELYYFHDSLILRSPKHSFSTSIDETLLLEKIKDEDFLEAIYIASPSLHNACIKLTNKNEGKDKNKVYLSVAKYLSRMNSRCTPFGLFAGVSVIQWGQNTNVVINSSIKRQTRLDMHFLCALAQKVAFSQPIRYQLKYFINSSYYILGNEVRYIEYFYQDGNRIHQISSIGYDYYIEKVISLTKEGLTFDKLVLAFIDNEINEEEASNFINQLIDTQFLVSELEPAITGNSFDIQILKILDSFSHLPDIQFLRDELESIQTQLKSIDSNLVNSIEEYKNITNMVKKLDIPFEENRLFQTDMNIQTQLNSSIDQRLKDDIYIALNCLLGLQKKEYNKNLLSFAERFYARYEHTEIPLQIALDTEIGIGYPDETIGDFTPLIDGLTLSNDYSHCQTRQEEAQKKILLKLQENKYLNSYEIALQESDFDLNHSLWENLPPSISVIFRVLSNNRILLESGGGSSACNILGRFAHLDKKIDQLINDVVVEEEYYNENVIFAEIIHLPESRTGNILLHPVFRKYEIPYLGKSSLDIPNQISLNDLYISVRDNHIYLRSKKFNKIIIPRLSNAHNYTNSTLPVYRFLCDLQNQGKITSVGFNWEEIVGQQKFRPRIRIKNAIIHLATWVLDRTDFESLLSANHEDSFIDFCNKYRLPRYFVITDHDNELLIDTQNPLLIQMFLSTLKYRLSITLKEFIIDEATGIKDTKNQLVSNQLIATLIRKKSCFENIKLIPSISHIQRSFSIGSEWLYFKIYCGVKNADRILNESVRHLVEQAYQQQLIKKWFFIRYNDPDFHIRLRFNLKDKNQSGELINLFYSFISKMEDQGIIWKIQVDTYQRELERYGNYSIELVESLFCIDSFCVLSFLSETQGDEREHIRWIYAIKSIDSILNAFEYTLEQKRGLLKSLKEAFAQEFSMNQHLKIQIGNLYRNNKVNIDSFPNKFPFLMNVLESKKENLNKVTKEIIALAKKGKLDVDMTSLLTSIIHMQINRIITSSPRLHELCIYDFSYRQYQSMWIQNRETANIFSF